MVLVGQAVPRWTDIKVNRAELEMEFPSEASAGETSSAATLPRLLNVAARTRLQSNGGGRAQANFRIASSSYSLLRETIRC